MQCINKFTKVSPESGDGWEVIGWAYGVGWVYGYVWAYVVGVCGCGMWLWYVVVVCGCLGEGLGESTSSVWIIHHHRHDNTQ